MRHSDIVYNLVGRDYETKFVKFRVLSTTLAYRSLRNFSYDAVHVDAPARIARIAKSLNVSRFVHVSHLNAAVDSTSRFYATKALGEEAVRKEFPDATIVRPGALFGYEDKLLNNIASALTASFRRSFD
jgi:NADH dehydrogenase (ubiquinone) 1 alpha subcomplex subunit 9